ncbi:hypothetical protein V5O48_017219, partial [Marasmius crinis-equi]
MALDIAISQVAKNRGDTKGTAKYVQRAQNFNVWNPNVSVPDAPAPGVKRMMQATCFLNAANLDRFYEGSPIIACLIRVLIPPLLASFSPSSPPSAASTSSFEPTDEPSQQISFMYTYADRPGPSTSRSREVLRGNFNTTVRGLPGNDDSDSSSSREITWFNPVFNSTTTMRSVGFTGEGG